MKTTWAVALAAGVGLVGCATPKTWMDVGGSRADGVVRLVYEYGGFEKPVVDDAAGLALATHRCTAWGYAGAEPFGAQLRECIASNAYGCIHWRVTAVCQCVGTPAK